MTDSKIIDCKIIELSSRHTNKGDLSVIESKKEIPFDICRVYYLYNVPKGQNRGNHAHKDLFQLIIAVSGSFTVTLDDGKDRHTYLLNHPNQGLLVIPGIWRTLENFSSDSVCLVLASLPYDQEDYIHDYEEFIDYKNHQS